MEEKINILIIDDEPRVADEIEEFLHTRDYTVFKSNVPSKAFKVLEKENINIVILDIKLPEMDGIEVLKKIKATYPDIEVIMISGHGDMEIVIQAMRFGATDYFAKPFRLFEIDNAISRTTKYLELNQKLKSVEQNVHELSKKILSTQGARLIGNSKPMKILIDLIEKVAKAENTSVLILGESGTGKELVAHGIHQLSKRSKKMFYSVNCSAVPESLFESEFFGHKKGAFTGAVEDKSGWFEISNNGTLFLDEISDMPLGQQAKLLRVLEERTVSKVGSRKSVDVDVRVVAASNTKLEELASENKFRLDLYHRLSVFVINVPPLRDRKDDIPLLLNYYLDFYNKQMQKQVLKVDDSVMSSLMNYNFPGNIRELRNIVERAVILCDTDTIKSEHVTLSGDLNSENNDSSSENIYSNDNLDLEYHERELIKMALKRTDNNKSKAAAMLNVTWQALDRRMKKFGLE